MTKLERCYHELSKLTSFDERFKYLMMFGAVGRETFGYDRYLNQEFYRSNEWRSLRKEIIVRDHGCDLGIDGREIQNGIYIHHMNPIEVSDIVNSEKWILDPEYLICVSFNTHNAIHYGNANTLPSPFIERKPGDTCPWKI